MPTEREAGLNAVRAAARLCAAVRSEMVTGTGADKLDKQDRSPVTIADFGAQAIVSRIIGESFPDDAFVAEEDSALLRDAANAMQLSAVRRFVAAEIGEGDETSVLNWIDRGKGEPGARFWVLDPIDGTKSFICGFPTWGTLIGLSHRGRPCYGLMHQPFTRERFHGDGEAAFWRGPARNGKGGEERRKLSVRPCPKLSQATLMTTSPLLIDPALRENFHRVEREVRLSRYGGDCYAYCALAAGHVDLVIETNLNPYDIVALIPIIEGAGGIVTTWSGGSAAQGGSIIAAGDRALHDAALKLLAS